MLGIGRGSAPSNGQPNVKRQKLDEGADSTVAGTSASAAIPIDDVADEDDDDDGIEILEDEDDNDANTAVVTVDAQGNATTSSPCTTNTAGSSTFAPLCWWIFTLTSWQTSRGRIVKRFLTSYESSIIT